MGIPSSRHLSSTCQITSKLSLREIQYTSNDLNTFRQIETTLQDEEDTSNPLMERAAKSKGTEVPFAEMDLDKLKEMTSEERDRLLERIGGMAGELGKEMEDVWEKTEGKKERGNVKKGTGEGAFGSEDLAQLVFNTVWGGQSTSKLKRAPEAKDGTSGSRGEDLVESGKTGTLEPLDDMDIDEEEVTVAEKVKRGKGTIIRTSGVMK